MAKKKTVVKKKSATQKKLSVTRKQSPARKKMSATKNNTPKATQKKSSAKEFVERLDWSSAIASVKLELDPNSNQTNQSVKEESYLYRGIARCFIPDKEGKHKEAIEDLSCAITLKKNDETYYYRAFAYYLDSDYERAITDCNNIKKDLPCLYRDELLGKIYFAMNKYEEAARKFAAALSCCVNNNPQIPNPGLLQSYNEACKKMNSV